MVFPGKKHSLVLIILVFILLVILTVYSRTDSLDFLARKALFSDTRFFMDTVVIIKVVDKRGRALQAIDEAFKVMNYWANQLDRFQGDSLVSEINQGNGQWVSVQPEVIALLTWIERYASLSNGALDPTVAPLMDLWGFGSAKQAVPASKEIAQVLKRISYKKLVINPEKSSVKLSPGMEIDLGGAAKGFVVDKGIESLKRAGIKSAYINAGGNVRVIGNKTPGIPWRIGIRKPPASNNRETLDYFSEYILSLNRGSLATSGDYERYFISGGIRYSHLLDPRTGYPARGLRSATIYCQEAGKADILSTTVFILGWDEGKKLIERLAGVEGLLIRVGEIWLSPGFQKLAEK